MLDLGVREGLGLGLKGLKWLGFGQELDYGSGKISVSSDMN